MTISPESQPSSEPDDTGTKDLTNYQLGEGERKSFPGEQPFIDQAGNGDPLGSDEITAQQRAIDEDAYRKEKRKKFVEKVRRLYLKNSL